MLNACRIPLLAVSFLGASAAFLGPIQTAAESVGGAILRDLKVGLKTTDIR